MNWSVKAILARFNGNSTAAIRYCDQMARTYPRLAEEYNGYLVEISAQAKSQAAAAGN